MVHTVIPLTGPVEQFLVVNRSSTAYVTTAQGQVWGLVWVVGLEFGSGSAAEAADARMPPPIHHESVDIHPQQAQTPNTKYHPERQVVKSMSSGKKAGGDFTCAAVSPKATYAYCAGEDGVVYCFNLQRGDLESFLKVMLRAGVCGGLGCGWG